jgi:hypothetical protein
MIQDLIHGKMLGLGLKLRITYNKISTQISSWFWGDDEDGNWGDNGDGNWGDDV